MWMLNSLFNEGLVDPIMTVDKKFPIKLTPESKAPQLPYLGIGTYYGADNCYAAWGLHVKSALGRLYNIKNQEPLPDQIRQVLWKIAVTTRAYKYEDHTDMARNIMEGLRTAKTENVTEYAAAVAVTAYTFRNYSFNPALFPYENHKKSATLLEPIFKETKLSGTAKNYMLSLMSGTDEKVPAMFKMLYRDISNLEYTRAGDAAMYEKRYRDQYDLIPDGMWYNWRIDQMDYALGPDPLPADNMIFDYPYLDVRESVHCFHHITRRMNYVKNKLNGVEETPEQREQRIKEAAEQAMVEYAEGFTGF